MEENKPTPAMLPQMVPNERIFNPDMLRLVRDVHQKSKKDVAEAIDLSPGFITQLEDGSKQPSHQTVEKLEAAFGFPLSFFYQNARYAGAPTSLFRKRQTITKGILNRCTARLALATMTIRKLLGEVEPPDCVIPRLDPQETDGGAVGIARLVRIYLRIPPGPIRSIVEILEEAGVIVVPFDFGTRKIDGCSDWIDDRPIIFFNTSSAKSRLRHTLAHELGHLVMHRIVDFEQCEKEADAFAGEFNMPAAEIRSHLLALNLNKLATLKAHWKSAMSAILYRAKVLGVVSDYKYKSLLIELHERNYHIDEPNEDLIPLERPQSIEHLLEAYFESMDADKESMLEHVKLREAVFNDILPRGRMLRAI
jgi:Zn-dependent peptidase ImmA (M78 family)/transcriptional regulator with XRE-family HTH domain